MHCVKFLIIKTTRCTNFSNLFLKWNSTCFRQFLCPPSGVFHCTHTNGICHTGLLTACEQDQDGSFWSRSQNVYKPVWHIPLLCVQWKTPDGGQRNCLKHVEFHSKNKLEKLVHLVGFIIRHICYLCCFPLTGIPYALHQAGFATGLLLLILVALATDYSLVLLIRSGHLSGAFSYQGLMEAAFGKPGFVLLSLLQFIYPFIGNYKSWVTASCI